MKSELISKITQSQKQFEELKTYAEDFFPNINPHELQDFNKIIFQQASKIKRLNPNSPLIETNNLEEFSEELLSELLEVSQSSNKSSLDWMNKIEEKYELSINK